MLSQSSARWRVNVRSNQKLAILLNSRYLSSDSDGPDHYGTLDINSNANQREIKNAYYKLSKQYHPDRNPGAADKFRKINEAYEVLSDVDSRRDYDRSRAGWKNLQKVPPTPKPTGFTKPTKLDKEDIARMFRERMANNQKNGTSEDRTRFTSWQENTTTQQGFSENMASSTPFNGPLLSEETLNDRSRLRRRNSSEPANIPGAGGKRIEFPIDPNVLGMTIFVIVVICLDAGGFGLNYPSLTDSKAKDDQAKD